MAAATEVATIKRLSEEESHSQRKRFKISELPLSPSQKSTIDSLLHTIKKKGEYDALRKRVWDQYVESVSEHHPITPDFTRHSNNNCSSG